MFSVRSVCTFASAVGACEVYTKLPSSPAGDVVQMGHVSLPAKQVVFSVMAVSIMIVCLFVAQCEWTGVLRHSFTSKSFHSLTTHSGYQ